MLKLDSKGFSVQHILLAVVAIGLVVGVGFNTYNSQMKSKQRAAVTTQKVGDAQVNQSMTIPSDWKEYTHPKTGVSLMLPPTLAVTDNDPASEGWVNFYVKPVSHTVENTYKNSETDAPGTTLIISVHASINKPADYKTETAGEFVKLGSEDKYKTLYTKNNYDYLFLTQGKRWGNFMYVLQCNQEKLCRSTMDRDHKYKYLQIVVSAEEDWRHGPNAIDTTSPEYLTMQTVIQSMKF